MTGDSQILSCRLFGDCGGCSSLNSAIAAQRGAKIDAVVRALEGHLGGTEPVFTDTPTSPPRYERMRILYPIAASQNTAAPGTHGIASPTMGLFRRGTHELVEIDSCETQHPALTEIGRRALSIFRRRRLSAYDETRHRGIFRAFGARLSNTTGEMVLGIVTTTEEIPDADGLVAELSEAASGLSDHRVPSDEGPDERIVGIVQNVNPHRGNALIGDRTTTRTGRGHIEDHVDGLVFRVSFASFYQLHHRSDALLYRPAMELLGPVEGLSVVDAYGGIGTFALRLAQRGAGPVTLVETNPSSCADARQNSAANDLPVDVLAQPFDRSVPGRSPDLLVVDPTRAGLQAEGRAAVARLAPRRILYVACGLKALARDLSALPGYRVESVVLADLFPHTPHVETIALLEAR